MQSFDSPIRMGRHRVETNGTGGTSAEACAALLLEIMPRIMRSVREVIAQRQPRHLTVPQFRTLLFVQAHEGVNLSLVAEFLALTLPSTSKLVDQMVQRRLLERSSDQVDRRRLTLRITREGDALMKDAYGAVRLHLAEILQRSRTDDLAVLQSALANLQEAFPAFAADARIGDPSPGLTKRKIEARV